MKPDGGPQLPATSEDAKVPVRQTPKEDLPTEVLERTAKGIAETGDAARTVVADAESQTAPSRLLSFAEVRDFLNAHGIDLEKHRAEAVKSALRWELIDEKSADEYGASFDNMDPIPETDLKELVRQIEADPTLEQRIIFGVDTMTPNQCFQKLIVGRGLPHSIWRRPYHESKNLPHDDLRTINQGFPVHKDWAPDSLYDYHSTWRELFSMYQRIDAKTRVFLENQEPSGKAGILFTPNIMNLPANLRNISAGRQLVEMVKGKKYVGPVGWLMLFRQCVDRALPILYPEEAKDIDSISPDDYRMLVLRAILDPRINEYVPDVTTGTQFPDLRHKDHKDEGPVPDDIWKLDNNIPDVTYLDEGTVPHLGFDSSPVQKLITYPGKPTLPKIFYNPYPQTPGVVLSSSFYTNHPHNDLGGRPALGNFLS